MTPPPTFDSVSFIGTGRPDLRAAAPETVGFKAYNLIRMDRIGLPVPPAFVLHTEVWRAFNEAGGCLPADFAGQIAGHLRLLESATGTTFGSTRRPLLVSVRAGAPVSMPGMLDSLMNIGLTDATVRGLVRLTGNPRLAWDSYRRLVRGYAEVTFGMPPDTFDASERARLVAEELGTVRQLDARALRELCQDHLRAVHAFTGDQFPQDPRVQLVAAIEGVLKSWQGTRATHYRRLRGFDDNMGTAVIVQAMVFGNAGPTSGAGVGFTRNPATGASELYLDFVANAQGEDVVAGRHVIGSVSRLGVAGPALDAEIEHVRRVLELELRDMQDFEFTVQDGRLFVLQTRTGTRTAPAAVRIAVDMVEEGLITPEEALARTARYAHEELVRFRLDPPAGEDLLATATPASVGAAVGVVALDVGSARERAAAGEPVILVREETSTDDIAALEIAVGLITAVGGRTSHAAVIARELGKTCLVGCSELHIDLEHRRCEIGGRWFAEGEYLSLDGDTGRIFAGRQPIAREEPDDALQRLAVWRAQAEGGSPGAGSS